MSNLNFTISEFVHSDTAVLNRINNMPDINSLDNLLALIFHCMQPLRDKSGRKIIITSGFRCLTLNRKIGSKDNSQHTKGQACDFIIDGLSVKQACLFIRNSGITYDQLIEEYGKNGNWVHISYNKDVKKNRKEYLIYQNGKYVKIK